LKISVVDIETTGLNVDIDYIVEIGIVDLDLDTGKIKVIYDKIVRELGFGEHNRNDWIFLNSDLNYKLVEKAPLLNELREDIQDILIKRQITAFNKSFDLGFLKDRGFIIPNELPCIMKSATNICKIPFPRNPYKYKWPKVEEAWNYFFPEEFYIEKHRAADDAKHEARILYEMYRLGYYNI